MSQPSNDQSRDGTLHEWFLARRDQVGTHSETCWKHHPDCAYWAGREQVARELDTAYQMRNDHHLSEYDAGVLYGLDIAEQVARGELGAKP